MIQAVDHLVEFQEEDKEDNNPMVEYHKEGEVSPVVEYHKEEDKE